MELSFEPPCQYATWKVRDFFQLPSEIGYSLDSPEIRFAGDSYCLRLYPNGKKKYPDGTRTEIDLVRLTSTYPEKNVSCKSGIYDRNRKENKSYEYLINTTTYSIYRMRSDIEECVDSTLTVLCCLNLKEESNKGSPQFKSSDAEEEEEGLSGQSVFSSRWKSFKMELSIESPWQNVTWKVPDFLQLPVETGYSLDSPEFRFADDCYCLRLYPNGVTIEDESHVILKVVRLTTTFPERYASCKVGFRRRKENGNVYNKYYCLDTLTGEFSIPRSDVQKNTRESVPNGIFSVICSMHLKDSGSPQSKASNTEEDQERLASVAGLQSDFRQLLQKGEQSDACVVVSGKEFPVHTSVLRARSPVFRAVFGLEEERLTVDDLDPEIFGEFLEYLYTGDFGAGLSDDNAVGLYAAADRYGVPTLKSECVAHMRRSLSVDSFCDVMTLSLRHREEDLLQRAIEFFKENLPRIIVTVKWQQFLAQNTTSANELLIKALVPGGQ